MSKLANHVTLFWSHDDTGYLVKYTDDWTGWTWDWIKK